MELQSTIDNLLQYEHSINNIVYRSVHTVVCTTLLQNELLTCRKPQPFLDRQ